MCFNCYMTTFNSDIRADMIMLEKELSIQTKMNTNLFYTVAKAIFRNRHYVEWQAFREVMKIIGVL